MFDCFRLCRTNHSYALVNFKLNLNIPMNWSSECVRVFQNFLVEVRMWPFVSFGICIRNFSPFNTQRKIYMYISAKTKYLTQWNYSNANQCGQIARCLSLGLSTKPIPNSGWRKLAYTARTLCICIYNRWLALFSYIYSYIYLYIYNIQSAICEPNGI